VTTGPDDEDDLGGDPACWLDRVCDTCGALVETDDHTCPADPGPTSGSSPGPTPSMARWRRRSQPRMTPRSLLVAR